MCRVHYYYRWALTSSQEHMSLSFMLFILASSLNSSIRQSIRFIREFARLVSDVGDNSCQITQQRRQRVCNIAYRQDKMNLDRMISDWSGAVYYPTK